MRFYFFVFKIFVHAQETCTNNVLSEMESATSDLICGDFVTLDSGEYKNFHDFRKMAFVDAEALCKACNADLPVLRNDQDIEDYR